MSSIRLINQIFWFSIVINPNFVQAVTESQYAAAINIAGRQRMLTQKMAKESLFMKLNISKEQNQQNRDKSIQLFEFSLNKLISGFVPMNLPKPPNNSIVQKLNVVKGLWPGYKKAITGTSASLISKLSNPILQQMDQAVKAYETAFFKAGFKGSGKNINIAGRQRMLTQRMAKELLLIAVKIDVEKNKGLLKKSIDLFELSLSALMNGDKNLSIEKTSSPEIIKQLQLVKGKWVDYQKVLVVGSGDKVSQEALVKLDEQSPQILFEMNKAVGMYQDEVDKNKKS